MKTLLTWLFLACLGFPALAQNPYRIADPQALSATGGGWSVNPRVGGLQMAVPVSVVPGEIPIPVVLRINGQFASQRTQFYYKDPDTFRWVEDYSASILRPIYGTQHFGYIGEAANYNGVDDSSIYVLESGAQFAQEDLVPFSTWVSDMSPVPTTFSLPQSFGLSSQAASVVQVTGDGLIATYDTAQAGLGSWSTTVGGLAASGYTRPTPGTYRVVMDKDRVRILQYLSEFKAWVPILWVDRYNHWVSFQWTRKTTSMPAGVSAIHTVEVKNQRGKGVRLEWAQFVQPFPTTDQDLLRADMINLDAPSILVRGLPGWSQLRPVGCNQSFSDSDTYVVPSIPGPIGRPRSIQVGPASQVAAPSWQGSAPYMIVYPPSNNPAPVLQWSLAYDAAQASITSFTEPNGTVTSFARYGTNVFTPISGAWASGRKEGWNSWSIQETVSTDVGGRVLRRDWTRSTSANNEPVVVTREVFGDWSQVQRKTELTYAAPGDAPHFGNGSLKQARVLDAAGTVEWSKTVYTLANAGLGRYYSNASGRVEERAGEQRRTYAMTLGTQNLLTVSTVEFIGTSNNSVQGETTTFDTRKDLLDLLRPLNVQVSRQNPDGSANYPILKRGMEYNGNGQLIRSYVDGGSLGKVGQSFTYTPDGKVDSESPYHSLLPTSAAKTYSYDSGTGALSNVRTSYSAATGGKDAPPPTIWMDQSWSNFDAFGRAQTLTDERLVSTSLVYDVRGRLRTSQRQGEGAVTYTYPDELTTSATQNGQTTTETRDGFGRVMSIAYPNGTTRTFGYDPHGRRNLVRLQSPLSLAPVDSMEFDPLDRPTKHTNASGTSEAWSYSTSGINNVAVHTTDAKAGGLSLVFTEHRNGLGQVIQSVAPTGNTTWFTYDGQGHVIQVRQAPSSGSPLQTRSFAFDALGRMTSRTEPETGITTFSNFTALGQPMTITEDKGADGLNRVQTLTWDALGRLTRQSASTGEYTSWTYEGLATRLPLETRNADGTIVTQAFEFQGGAGKQLSKETTTAPGWTSTLAYGYDSATGQLTSLTYPSGRIVGYGYDALGRVNRVTANGQTVVNDITFNEWGQRQRLTFGSGAYSDWTTQKGGTQLDKWNIGYVTVTNGLNDPGTPRQYTYDDAQRLTQAGEWSLVHDKEDRIVTASASGLGLATDFDHDPYGNNIKSVSTGAASAQVNNFNFGAQVGNQIPTLTSAGQATGWQYNARGETTRLSRRADGSFQGVTWDGLGRVGSISDFGFGGLGASTTTYAPSGFRTASTVQGNVPQSRRYVYSASGLLLAEQGQDTFTAHGGNKAFRVGHSPNEFSGIASASLGTFKGGETVTASVWFWAPAGVHGEMFLGDAGGADPYDNSAYGSLMGNGGWQQLILTRTLTHDDQLWVYLYSDQWSIPDHTMIPAHPGTIYDDLVVTGTLRGTVVNEGFEGQWPFGSWYSGVSDFGSVTTGESNPLSWKRDVIYLGSEAIAEVDAFGIHELHNDHLGTPRIITRGGTDANKATIEGRQAYAAYGERILAEGYQPLTGFTGHVQNDPTGLIYMRGRYFSPAWHAFLNSDQGVDPTSLHQRAYVGGRPFMSVDPSGMRNSQPGARDSWRWDWARLFGFWLGEFYGVNSAVVEVTDSSPFPDYFDVSYTPPFGWGYNGPPLMPGGAGGAPAPPQSPKPDPCSQSSFSQRWKNNVSTTRNSTTGKLISLFKGPLTSAATARAMGGLSPLQAIRLIGTGASSGSVWEGAALFSTPGVIAVNALAGTVAYEGGIALGSLLPAAVGEDAAASLLSAMAGGPGVTSSLAQASVDYQAWKANGCK